MAKKQKLELTWIGKDEEVKLEPRVLVEDTELSYGDKDTQNMIIHGDNLLALKALEQDYAGKVKCIYIDPPYNTGSRINADGDEVGYDDGLEHSEWLRMMKPRLELLYSLLAKDGTMTIQIDDNEYARLYLLMVDIFRERNLKTIVVKMSEATGVKMAHVINKGRIPKLKEYLIIARKDGIKDLYLEKIPKDKWDNEYKTFLNNFTYDELNKLKEIVDNEERTIDDIKICDEILEKIEFISLSQIYKDNNIKDAKDKDNFNFENAWRIVQIASMSGSAKQIADSKRTVITGNAFAITTSQKKMYFIKNHYDLAVKTPRIKLLFADDYLTIHPGDFWQDIKTTGLDNEGGVDFKKGKKPEELIRRIIKMSSKEGDLVLDSFAGSGTTPAVAHKMNRKWIGIEMGPHCLSHTMPRIRNVIDGNDNQGITQKVRWQGGGGFKYFRLAPSLLTKDRFGNWIIEPSYDATLLASAVAKQEGFKYFPHESFYWKQGYSTETDYIFTTTQFVTVEMIDKIHEEMKEDETLLICAKSFQDVSESTYSNITIKKIPKVLLGKCEFGRDDYSLNIVENSDDEQSEDEDE